MDTPENLIEKEFQYNSDNNFLEYNDFREKYMFSNVEHKYRIKIFEINYDKKVINEIIERVEKCREYLDKLWRNNNF
jgi:hypothetical protein